MMMVLTGKDRRRIMQRTLALPLGPVKDTQMEFVSGGRAPRPPRGWGSPRLTAGAGGAVAQNVPLNRVKGVKVERHIVARPATDAAVLQSEHEKFVAVRKEKEEKLKAFQASIQKRLEETAKAQAEARRAAVKEARNTLEHMQQVADAVEEASRRAFCGKKKHKLEKASGKLTQEWSLRDQIQQVLASADNAREMLLAHKGTDDQDSASETVQPIKIADAQTTTKARTGGKERTRYNDALKQRISQRCKDLGIALAPLCNCAENQDTSPLDPSYIDRCANNCVLYKNPQMYDHLLKQMLTTIGVLE